MGIGFLFWSRRGWIGRVRFDVLAQITTQTIGELNIDAMVLWQSNLGQNPPLSQPCDFSPKCRVDLFGFASAIAMPLAHQAGYKPSGDPKAS